MDISIIVPVYNAEKYLERCLESVMLSLGKVRGEVILVDNNSTDGSRRIMEKFHAEYPKTIQIVRCETPGAAAARNFGVKKAHGDYIWFVDADDTIEKDAVQLLLGEAREKDADIVMTGMVRHYADRHTDVLSAVLPEEQNFRSRFVRYGMGPVQLLIRRSWWNRHNLQFREGIIHEDMELMSALILYTDRFAAIRKPVYNYYQNSGSILHQESFNPQIFDIFVALEGLYQRFETAGAIQDYRDELEWFFIWNLLVDSAKDFGRWPEGKSGFKRSREMLRNYFPTWRHNKFLHAKPLKFRILVRINYSR